MRVPLDENVPGSVARLLRERGHDVLAAKESLRGAGDRVVLARAEAERRVVVTQDKDFGELAFRVRLPSACGVILFRMEGADPAVVVRRMLEVVVGREDWTGHFAVVTKSRIRLRALP